MKEKLCFLTFIQQRIHSFPRRSSDLGKECKIGRVSSVLHVRPITRLNVEIQGYILFLPQCRNNILYWNIRMIIRF